MAKIGYIQITRECNQKCIICSNPPTGMIISLQKAKRAIDELKNDGNTGVIITGGEPTVYPRLADLISYANQKAISVRIITNGQKMAQKSFVSKLKRAGLEHAHMSLYSCRSKVQAAISQNDKSLENIRKALTNLEEIGGITVDINIAINKLNADHLSETVRWVVKTFPFVHHFVFNNLDPYMNRAAENKHVVHSLKDSELELHRALAFLDRNGRTFRVERMPLCYMAGFEFSSTETRKIVKQEGRTLFFLDERGKLEQESWQYKKFACCEHCTLKDICAGLYGGDLFYSSKELHAVFGEKETIIKKIKEEN